MHEQVHPEMSKADKKLLCGILDCQRLSPEVRAHAVKNELLPLRTVVQLLYFEQEKGSKAATTSHKLPKPHEILLGAKHRPATNTRDAQSKQSLALDKEELNGEEVTRASLPPESREKNHHKSKRSDGKLSLDLERKMVIRGDTEETESQKVKGAAKEESVSSCKLELDPKKIIQRARSKSEHGREKGR